MGVSLSAMCQDIVVRVCTVYDILVFMEPTKSRGDFLEGDISEKEYFFDNGDSCVNYNDVTWT